MTDINDLPLDDETADHNTELLAFADTLDTQDRQDSTIAQQDEAKALELASQGVIQASAKVIGGVLSGAVAFAEKRYQGLNLIWTEEVINDTAQAAAAVLVKYDLSAPEFTGKYAAEINLMMTMGPPAFATWLLIRVQLAAEKQEAAKASAGLPKIEHNLQP